MRAIGLFVVGAEGGGEDGGGRMEMSRRWRFRLEWAFMADSLAAHLVTPGAKMLVGPS